MDKKYNKVVTMRRQRLPPKRTYFVECSPLEVHF